MTGAGDSPGGAGSEGAGSGGPGSEGSSASGWRPAPGGALSLDPGEVHVWRVPLAHPPDRLGALAGTLSPDERERAARFHFDRDRTAYTAARGALRTLASAYLGCAPAALAFGYRERGKPYLTAPAGAPLRFNVSHSGGLALVAFTLGRELGVDIERKREMSDLLSLARTSFTHLEYATLCRLPPAVHTDSFFACWSRKEAFIKATGEGIAQLEDFDVNVRADEPSRLLRVPGPASSPPRWSIHDLPPTPDYASALVIEGDAIRIACWDWPPSW